jgi:hypothetical protein
VWDNPASVFGAAGFSIWALKDLADIAAEGTAWNQAAAHA